MHVAVLGLSGRKHVKKLTQFFFTHNNSEECVDLKIYLMLLQAVEFLELVKTFKEYGFKEENIHESLKAADNDREKALEYLMTLSST